MESLERQYSQSLLGTDFQRHVARIPKGKPPTSPYDARVNELSDRFRKWTGYRMTFPFMKKIIHGMKIEDAQAWIDRLESEEIHDGKGMPQEMRVGYIINRAFQKHDKNFQAM